MRLRRSLFLEPLAVEGNGVADAAQSANDAPGDSSTPRENEDSQPSDERKDSSPSGEKPSGYQKALDSLRPDDEEGSPLPGDGDSVGDDESAGDKDGQPGEGSKPADVLSQADTEAFKKAFDERPEWKGILTLAGPNAKKVMPLLRQVYQRETALGQQVSEMQPMADIGRRIRAATEDEAASANAVALVEKWFAGEPEALDILKNLTADLEKRLGRVLQSDDLVKKKEAIQRKLQDGLITEDDAEEQNAMLLEIEKSRAETQKASRNAKQFQAGRQDEQLNSLIQSRTMALNEWEKNGPLKNTDYASRPELRNRVLADAKEMVREREQELGRLLNATEIVEVAEKSYRSVVDFVSSFLPKTTRSRVATGQSSSATANARPRTYGEALNRAEQML